MSCRKVFFYGRKSFLQHKRKFVERLSFMDMSAFRPTNLHRPLLEMNLLCSGI